MTEKIMMLGADIGKRRDPTAVAVAIVEQRENGDGARKETHYSIPHLRRLLPLGQPYPQQAREVVRLAEAALDKFKNMPGVDPNFKSVDFFMDVTGVGDGFVDLIKPFLRDKFHVVPCRFVHGDKLGKGIDEYRPGKSWFANRLQILSEGKQIHISPDNPEAEAVATELMDFDIEVDETTGIDRYGAMRPGTHDDMVSALGLACMTDPFSSDIIMLTFSTTPIRRAYADVYQDFREC